MKRCCAAIAASALMLAGCGGGGGSSTPSNPSNLLVTVDFQGGPFPGAAVVLSTGLNNQTPTGVITTTSTNSAGQVTLSLPLDSTLCVSASETTTNGTAFAANCFSQPFPSTLTLTLN